MRSSIAALKVFFFLVICVITVPIQMTVLLFTRKHAAYFMPKFFHKLSCLCFGIKVKVSGSPIHNKQTIFLSNHLSYLDIIAIGSRVKASFVAKKDVASWPVFGFLSRLQQTAFISRDRKDAKTEKNALDNMLAEGKSLIIFPEGTSTDGREVVPFKSSLFSIALREDTQKLFIQPFSIAMEHVNNLPPETQELRDLYSWHNNMDTSLASHLWLFAKSKGANITLNFHDAFYAQDHKDRKTLAKHCYDVVSSDIKSKFQ